MDEKDVRAKLQVVSGGKSGPAPESKLTFTVPKGSIWAVLVVGPGGGLTFSIETIGATRSQHQTLLEGTLLAHNDILHRFLDNGRRTVNDLIPPSMRMVVTDIPNEPETPEPEG